MTLDRFDVVGIGLNSVDLLCRVDHFPQFNTKNALLEVSRQGGGQAATAMAALSRLGLKTAYIGAVSDDGDGEFSIASLKEAGVNTDGVVVQPGLATQFAVIIVQGEGNEEERGGRTILWRREVMLRVKDISEKMVKSARIIHVDGHSMEGEIQAAHWAKEEGILVSFDAERVVLGVEELIPLTDYLVANDAFPEAMTGIRDPRKALRELHKMGPRFVAMTKGSRGVLAFDGSRFYDSPGFEVEVVDTTGAGDVFHAGLIFGLLEGYETPRMLQFANGLAALSCRALGGRAALGTREEVEKFIAEPFQQGER
ncbi:MAG: PfkB family carbohydrate kinase [Nitrospinota bacterium]